MTNLEIDPFPYCLISSDPPACVRQSTTDKSYLHRIKIIINNDQNNDQNND